MPPPSQGTRLSLALPALRPQRLRTRSLIPSLRDEGRSAQKKIGHARLLRRAAGVHRFVVKRKAKALITHWIGLSITAPFVMVARVQAVALQHECGFALLLPIYGLGL